MSQDFFYPPGSSNVVSVNINAEGTIGAPIPGEAILVGGENPSGDLQPLQTDVAGALIVTTTPSGTQNVNLTQVGGAAISEGQKLMAASIPITIASDQSALAVTGPLTDTQLRAVAVPVSGPLTDAQLRATPVPISGTTSTSNGLTDAQLRATAVPVSGPLTDAQLRATPVPISGTVATGGLTDAQLRATPVPVTANAGTGTFAISAVSLPLPTGAATEATLSTLNAKTAAAFVPTAFDYAAITYVGATTDINTVVYKTGGAGGSTVATLTMGYDGSNRLNSITKTP